MNTLGKISAAAFLAAAGLSFSQSVSALGLGNAEVQSYLNQPLKARIGLINVDEEDLASLQARLASAADYEMIGASRESVSVPIRFAIEQSGEETYILATSKKPLSDPIVRLIVEVDWASGRVLREYTLFLDPASVPAEPPLPRMNEQGQVRQAATPPPPSATQSRSPEPAAQAPSEARAAGLASGEEYGPVRGGETLWGIASNWSRGSGMDVNQVMLAIQRENPSAFLNGNINLLKRGAILRMPEAADVSSLSSGEAAREVTEQGRAVDGSRSASVSSVDQAPEQTQPQAISEETTPLVSTDTPSTTAMVDQPLDSSASAVESVDPTDIDSLAGDQLGASDDLASESSVSAEQEAAEATSIQDQLELIPPSENTELDSVYGFEESPEQAGVNDAGDVTALRENLARTEEELINEQQENEYLQDRIRELEEQLADQQEDAVNDADLASMQQRLEQERQQEAQQEQSTESWLSGLSALWVGLLVLVALGAGWLLSRRGRSRFEDEESAGEEALREIKEEAREVLRVLDEPDDAKPETDDADSEVAPSEDSIASDEEAEPSDQEGSEEPAPEQPAKTPMSDEDATAEFLDEESSDPEIQLDLARAYISMGDKEAARMILDEVDANGTDEQKAEAQAMREQLS